MAAVKRLHVLRHGVVNNLWFFGISESIRNNFEKKKKKYIYIYIYISLNPVLGVDCNTGWSTISCTCTFIEEETVQIC